MRNDIWTILVLMLLFSPETWLLRIGVAMLGVIVLLQVAQIQATVAGNPFLQEEIERGKKQ